MIYRTLVIKLIKTFPELEDLYKKEMDWSGTIDPLPHIIFGDVLNPFIKKQIIKMENLELLNRIFHFLEQMANSEDEDVQGVLTATVLEWLGDDKVILEKARKLMGKETLRLSHEVEKMLGREI
jgi:hypothetical protein